MAGHHRTIETNNEGVFTAPAPDAGEGYVVSVTKDGFAKYQTTNIPVQVGQSLELRIILNVPRRPRR